jgi:hypothetical protein
MAFPSAPAPGSRYILETYYGSTIPWIIGSGRVKGTCIYLDAVDGGGDDVLGFKVYPWIGSTSAKFRGKVAPAALAFCLAPATGSATIRTLFQGTQKTTDVSNSLARMSAGTIAPYYSDFPYYHGTYHPGATAGAWEMVYSLSDTPWSYLSGKALAGSAWYGLVHYRSDKLALDEQGKVPEYEATIAMPGADADGFVRPDVALKELLGNPLVGMGMSSGDIITDVGPDGTYASSWAAWIDNHVEFSKVARVLDDPTKLWTYVADLLEAGWADGYWRDDQYVVVPRDDVSKGTFTPAGAAYAINTAHTIGQNPIRRIDAKQSEKFNIWKVDFRDAARDFADGHATSTVGDADIRRTRARIAPTVENAWVVTQAHASALANAKCKQALHNRRRYELSLHLGCSYLEPTNLLQLSDGKQLSSQLVKVDRIRLNGNKLDVECAEWVQGNATPVDVTPQAYVENRPLVNRTPATDALDEALAAQDQASISFSAATDGQSDGVIEAFDRFMLDNWEIATAYAHGTISVQSGGVAGGKVLRVATDGSGTGLIMARSALIPFDPERLYHLRISVRQTAGTAVMFYVGWQAVQGDGTTVVSSSGTTGDWNSFTAIGANPGISSSWTALSGYWKGYGASNIGSGTISAPGVLHTTTRYIRPVIYVPDAGASGVFEFDTIQVVVTDPAALAIVASQITAGELKTSNYAESGGNPTAGAKLDHTGTALKVAAGNLQIGTYLMSNLVQVAFRANVYRSGGSIGVNRQYNVTSAARVDRGSGTPRYIIQITLPITIPTGALILLASTPMDSSTATAYSFQDVQQTLPSSTLDIGMASGSSWVDPGSYDWGFTVLGFMAVG